MRRVVFAIGIVAGLQMCVGLAETACAADDDKYQNKTLKLRTGPLTLEPTQAPAPPPSDAARPKAKSPAEPLKRGSPPKQGRNLRSADPAAETASRPRPRAVNKPITSERVIVNFERRVTDADRRALAGNGIEVGEYLGDTAYTAKIRQNNVEALVRATEGINVARHVVALDEHSAHIKIDPALSAQQPGPREAARAGARVAQPINVVVELWPETNVGTAKGSLERYGQVVRVSPRTRKIEMSVTNYENVEAIAKLAGVKFISPSYGIKSQNTHVRRNMGIDLATGTPHFLSGRNVRVGVWDGGHVAADHPSFTSRLSDGTQREQVARHDDMHATHVAGTIGGSGEFVLLQPAVAADGRPAPLQEGKLPRGGEELARRDAVAARTAVPAPTAERPTRSDPRYPGMAVGAHIVSFDFFGAADELLGLLIDEPGAVDVTNNSWGMRLDASSCSQLAAYNILDAPDFDAVISGQKDGQPIRRIPIVFSAGNTRNDGLDGLCNLSTSPGFPNFRTVVAPGTAKNVITVGAIDADNNAMTDFSSWGPTTNGRLKPDIVAPGCRILDDGEQGIVSMFPPKGLGRMCGTSMAAPAVTGVLALLIEKAEKLGLAKPEVFPSTYKALLIHGAEDLGRPGPDFEFGYGRVRLDPTLKLMDARAFQQLAIEREGEVQSRQVDVPPGSSELKVTLAWDDRPTGVFAEEALANDLDLVLVSSAGERHLPLLLNGVPGKETEPARPGVDRLNVVEQILVKRPSAGAWHVQVRASKMAVGGQTYTLVTSVQ